MKIGYTIDMFQLIGLIIGILGFIGMMIFCAWLNHTEKITKRGINNMSEINLKLKSYDELIFVITTLNTKKYLLELKLNKQKKVLDKIKEKVKELDRFDPCGSMAVSMSISQFQEDLERLLEEIE